MADYNQVPGELNITIGYGDELALPIDFDIALTGYTFEAKVIQGGEVGTEVEFPMIVSGTNLSSGQISLYLTETQIEEIETRDNSWYLLWTVGGVSRRALAGTFKVIRFP